MKKNLSIGLLVLTCLTGSVTTFSNTPHYCSEAIICTNSSGSAVAYGSACVAGDCGTCFPNACPRGTHAEK